MKCGHLLTLGLINASHLPQTVVCSNSQSRWMLHKVILIILHLFLYVECELEVILEHRFKRNSTDFVMYLPRSWLLWNIPFFMTLFLWGFRTYQMYLDNILLIRVIFIKIQSGFRCYMYIHNLLHDASYTSPNIVLSALVIAKVLLVPWNTVNNVSKLGGEIIFKWIWNFSSFVTLCYPTSWNDPCTKCVCTKVIHVHVRGEGADTTFF